MLKEEVWQCTADGINMVTRKWYAAKCRGGCQCSRRRVWQYCRASSYGDEKVVQILLSAGADVNAQGGEYGNALQAASRYGYEKVVQMLLSAGADVNAQGGEYGNALQAASSYGDEKVVQIREGQGGEWQILVTAEC